MRISAGEQAAIREVIRLGDEYGFGNLISHLKTAWMRRLIADGLREETAKAAACGGTFYPPLMQEDLIERGEWDHTGERYSRYV